MEIENFFKPYHDTIIAHVIEIIEAVALLFIILWIQTGVTSGTSEFDIVDFTFKLNIIALIFKVADFVIWYVTPGKVEGSLIQTIGLGSGWRAFWGAVIGVTSIGFLSGGTNLSFFSTFLQFNTVYMFFFLVMIGPRIEEMFSNVLHPLATRIIMLFGQAQGQRMSYLTAGTLSLLLVVAPLFGIFHYFTYYAKSGADTSLLIIMMFAAYVYRCIFTVGNYVLKTDEYGKFAHMTHNLIGYWVTVGNPFKILPEHQLILIVGAFIAVGVYYSSYIVYRLGRYGLYGLKPDTVLDDWR